MRATAIGLVFALISVPVFAQGREGEIRGTILDVSGQPRPNQQLELVMPRSDLRRVAVSDANGQFVYDKLEPGRYEVQMRSDGRVVARSEIVELRVGALKVHDVVVCPPPASWFPVARPVQPLPRRSAKALLQGGPAVQSFEALQAILKPGQDVFVGTTTGFMTRGRVSSISSDGLVLEGLERKWGEIWGSTGQERAFDADSIRRIEVPDSLWNGAFFGAMGAIGLTAAWAEIACSSSCYDERVAVGIVFLVPAGAGLGAGIDSLIRAPIYVRPGEKPRVSLSPMLGPHQEGIAVRVNF